MNVGKRLKTIRKIEKYTKKEMITALKINSGELEIYENKGDNIPLNTLQRISKKHKEYAYWLITGKIDPPKHINPFIKKRMKFKII